jgi:hypothetical protein
MSNLRELQSRLLADGAITEAEVDVIRDYVASDNRLDLDDIKFLIGLRTEARTVCSSFDNLFFPLFKHVVLEDQQVGQDEMYYLLKMLYSDGQITDRERDFLKELRGELEHITPQFESLYNTALAAPSINWDV